MPNARVGGWPLTYAHGKKIDCFEDASGRTILANIELNYEG